MINLRYSKRFLFAFLTLLTIGFTSISRAEVLYNVGNIHDGDTLTLTTGQKVRFLQIDAPELNTECYGKESREALVRLLGSNSVALQSDSVSADKDRFTRLLRYVFVGTTNINLRLVEIGAAAPYFFEGEKGMYWSQLMSAAKTAQQKKIGLWGACPGTKLNPSKMIDTGSVKLKK